MRLGGQRDRDQKVVDAPVERVVVLEWYLQHGHAVAGRRARGADPHLALEHACPAAAAGALRLDLQRHVHRQDERPATAQKLRRASSHWMRHTHASHVLARGAELIMVRDNLRHASISTTSTYLHSDEV